ncbi:glycosyltransferase family 2 protein [Salinibacterium sp. dk2585]|nr:glycosyltransferase family 2 protein [Salinibacterium sp. dk2585]TXK54148.1 glycosyltransferase family 2 protein [Salinibacterium sp. dk5596]
MDRRLGGVRRGRGHPLRCGTGNVTRLAVVTIAHGRHDHLRMQHLGIAASHRLPDDHIVVAMDDPDLLRWRPVRAPAPHVVPIARDRLGLPLAAARNLGAEVAIARGADVLVFLDVDCIPGPELVPAYLLAALNGETRNDLLCGPVAYLPPPPPGGYRLDELDAMAPPHPARPAPAPGTVERGGDHRLFWSLSFAVTRDTWRRIGGFHADYVGYGGEDTDFARVAAERGVEIAWLGSARAYHQHHAVESPPVRHLDDILRNGAIYAERWGEWPMEGWFEGFERLGLVERDGPGWRATSKGADA